MLRRCGHYVSPGLPLLLAAVVAPAQDSPAPVEANLTVRLPAGKSTYAIGELIPLELEFRGRAGADYYFDTRNYDRRGRMLTEEYEISPAVGLEDPLQEYYLAFAGPGGGLGGSQPLDGRPLRLRVHLNEWVRFDRPGDYALVVKSGRLRRYSTRPAPELVSRPIDLCIERPTPGWAAAELARGLAAVERGQPEGLAILRHLGTREAAMALVRLHAAGGRGDEFTTLAGLVSSPWRKETVVAMEERLDAGERLGPGFARDLAVVRSLLEMPAGSDPRLRIDKLKADECAYAIRWGRAVLRRGVRSDLLAALLAARAENADPECEGPLAGVLAEHPAPARSAFLALPAATQLTLLQARWEAIDGAWIEPALEALLERWSGDSRFPGAGDWALRRIAERDRSRGVSLALAEVRTGRHGLTLDTLTSILEGPLPGLDSALRERFETASTIEAQATAMWLVAKYGSAGLLPFVKEELERGPYCDLEAAAIVYLLTHDPQSALPRLQPGFDRSRPGMCVVAPWQEIAPRHWDDRVEDAAIGGLGARAAVLVRTAAQTLQAYGSARTKGPLMDRLARWEAEWRGREKELLGPVDWDSPVTIENGLVNALLGNPRIVLTSLEEARLRALCVTESCRMNVDVQLAMRRRGDAP